MIQLKCSTNKPIYVFFSRSYILFLSFDIKRIFRSRKRTHTRLDREENDIDKTNPTTEKIYNDNCMLYLYVVCMINAWMCIVKINLYVVKYFVLKWGAGLISAKSWVCEREHIVFQRFEMYWRCKEIITWIKCYMVTQISGDSAI